MIRSVSPALLLIFTTAGEPVPEGRSHLDTALDLLQTHSAETSKTDWPRLRTEAHRDAAHARHAADTRPVIKRVVAELGNPHTALLTSPGGGPPAAARPRRPPELGGRPARNSGGDMYPMLTVVAPLQGEGGKGAFVRPAGRMATPRSPRTRSSTATTRSTRRSSGWPDGPNPAARPRSAS